MFERTPTAEQLEEMLTHLLVGAAGGEEAEWREAIGQIIVLPIALHPRGNWRVEPRGTAKQRQALTEAARLLAEAEPYALPPKSD